MLVRCSFRYEELLSIYNKFLVYLKRVGRHSISNSSVPELLGRYFGKEERQSAGLEDDPSILSAFFLNHEFTEAPPELHVKTLSALVTMTLDSKAFRTYMANAEEKLHDIRRTRWARPTKKKDVEAQISALDKKIIDMDRQIDIVEKKRPLPLSAYLAFKSDHPIGAMVDVIDAGRAAHLRINGDEIVTIVECGKAVIGDQRAVFHDC